MCVVLLAKVLGKLVQKRAVGHVLLAEPVILAIKWEAIMSRPIRLLLSGSLVVFALSIATCYFGVNYEVSKIPPEVRKGMSDTDWIGVEWIGGGMLLSLLSIALFITAAILFLRQKRSRNVN